MAREKSMATTVKLSNSDDYIEAVNGNAADAFLPGDVVEFVNPTTIQAHSTAGGPVLPLMVVVPNPRTPPEDENETMARIGYPVGDLAQVGLPEDGEIWLLRMPAGATIAFGDVLVSDGDGKVVTGTIDDTTPVGAVIGVAAESKDNSGNSSPALVQVRIARA